MLVGSQTAKASYWLDASFANEFAAEKVCYRKFAAQVLIQARVVPEVMRLLQGAWLIWCMHYPQKRGIELVNIEVVTEIIWSIS